MTIKRPVGTTQEAFARLLNVSVRTVQRWEKGINIPRSEYLAKQKATYPTDTLYPIRPPNTTQKSFAASLGVSRQTVASWERKQKEAGQSRPEYVSVKWWLKNRSQHPNIFIPVRSGRKVLYGVGPAHPASIWPSLAKAPIPVTVLETEDYKNEIKLQSL